MRKIISYVAVFIAGAIVCGIILFAVLHNQSSGLSAAIAGYRASETADYIDRKRRIADLVTIGRESAGIIRDLRQGIIDAQTAENNRRRAEEERTKRLGEGIDAAIKSSTNTTELLRQLIEQIRGFLGE